MNFKRVRESRSEIYLQTYNFTYLTQVSFYTLDKPLLSMQIHTPYQCLELGNIHVVRKVIYSICLDLY